MTEVIRGRSGRMPRDVRRAQLLSAAQEVFVANGYHGAAMDEIAETAKVSKPVLYQHFPSKRDLYLAVLDDLLQELTETMLAAMESTNDNRQRVKATITAYFEFIAKDNQAHRLVFENDLNDPEVSEKLEEYSSTYANAIAQVIQKDTALSLSRAQLLGRALAGMSNVSARYWLQSLPDVPLEDAAELIYRLAWRGISRFPMEGLTQGS